jgi:hypothetical protein
MIKVENKRQDAYVMRCRRTGAAEDRCLTATTPRFHDWKNEAVGDR